MRGHMVQAQFPAMAVDHIPYDLRTGLLAVNGSVTADGSETFPVVIAAAVIQTSSASFTQAGTGMVRT